MKTIRGNWFHIPDKPYCKTDEACSTYEVAHGCDYCIYCFLRNNYIYPEILKDLLSGEEKIELQKIARAEADKHKEEIIHEY